MKKILALLLISCGADADQVDAGAADPVVAAVYDASLHRAFSINGPTLPDGGWFPTGVAFDDRPEGWRVSCLNGVTPAFTYARGGGVAWVTCGQPSAR